MITQLRNELLTELKQMLAASQSDTFEKSITRIYKHLIIKKIRIATLTGFSLVNVESIVRCEASGCYTIIFFSDQKSLTSCKTLNEYEKELTSYGFVRIHRKHLINVQYVIAYHKGGKNGGYVTLQGEELVAVSIRKKDNLLDAIR